MDRRHFIAGAAGIGLGSGRLHAAAALQPFADRPIRIVVPYAAGGVADVITRICIDNLGTTLGAASLIVENRPGAGGNIGAEFVGRRPADGNTFLVGPSSLITTNPFVPQLRINSLDIVKALTAVAPLADPLFTLIVPSSLGATTMAQFSERAKGGPPLRVGNAGTGTPNHLIALLLEKALGVQFVHVAYKGSSPMITDLAGGYIDAGIGTVPSALPMVRDGRLKWIGIFQPGASAVLPGVPSISASLNGASVPTWTGVFAPTGVPVPMLDAMGAALQASVRNPTVTARLHENGLEPLFWSRAQMETRTSAETEFMKEFLSRVKIDFST